MANVAVVRSKFSHWVCENMKFMQHLPDVAADEYCGEFEPKG